MVIAQELRTDGAAAEFAVALDDRRSGQGRVPRCPAPHDRYPSLSISNGADGRLLLRCFAGCSWRAVQQAFEARSLWPEPHTPLGAHQTYLRKPCDPLDAAERCLVWELS